MRRTTVLAFVVTVIAGLAVTATANAANDGTFTHITSPSGPIYIDATHGGGLTIKGVAASSITGVNVYCYYNDDNSSSGALNSLPIAVTDGKFSGEISAPFIPQGCILRALPSTAPPPTYVSSFTGPLLLGYLAAPETTNSTTTGAYVYAAGLAGNAITETADQGGIINPTPEDPVTREAMSLFVAVAGDYGFDNVNGTASPIIVDGHDAYTPYDVVNQLEDDTTETYTPLPLTTKFTHQKSTGDNTMIVTSPLVRCSVSDAATPTATTCPSVVRLPVNLVQKTVVSGNGRQFSQQLAFASTNGHAHTAGIEVITVLDSPSNGALGYLFPNGAKKFAAFGTGPHPITGLPAGPQSVIATSNIDAAAGDPHTSLVALTTASRPSKLQLIGDSLLVTTENRAVPARGSSGFSLEVSTGLSVNNVKALAKTAQKSLAGSLSITSPKPAKTLRHHKVLVKVTAIASGDGLPTKITINGNTATLTSSTSTTGHYAATITLKPGKRTITAKATQPAGNTTTAHITVHVG